MDKGLKWLGVCVLLSAIVISAASVYKAKINIKPEMREPRYEFDMPDIRAFSVIDKETGTIYYYDGISFKEFNPVTKHYLETKIK
jgi:hypothetical protein